MKIWHVEHNCRALVQQIFVGRNPTFSLKIVNILTLLGYRSESEDVEENRVKALHKSIVS